MKPYWSNGRAVLWQGHVLDVLAAMESQSVHMAATSPPYWGLRDYGIEGVEWPAVSYAPMAGLAEIEMPGCAEGCAHVWGEELDVERTGKPGSAKQASNVGANEVRGAGQYCQLCGGWRGSLGLEPTVEMYVGHLVLIFRELKRVLRDDACFFLNLGDSYNGGGTHHGTNNSGMSASAKRQQFEGTTKAPGLKPKDLIGIPWRVALALQADGWYLRSDIIWAKGVSFCPTYSGSCMPESVRDRPTTSYEHVFLLAKNKRYFYDADAVREESLELVGGGPPRRSNKMMASDRDGSIIPYERGSGRNLRSVWTINPGSYAGAHFATFPPKLVEPMIRAGTSTKGCCPECGAPWKRVTDRKGSPSLATGGLDPQGVGSLRDENGKIHWGDQHPNKNPDRWMPKITTTGWTPTCTCDAGEPVPAIVLDPFAGTATTLDVAIRLGRRGVGIELSKPYCDDHIIPRLSKGIQMEMNL